MPPPPPPDRRTAVLVVDPGSRGGAHLLEDAPARFARAGLRLLGAHRVEDDLHAAVDAAIADGPDAVVRAGGDGAVASAVGRFALRDAVLGLVPTGTTNDVARSLGLPLHPDASLRCIAAGVIADVDLGKAGDEHFADVSTVGTPVSVAHHVPAGLKRVLGRAACALTGLVQLVRHRSIVLHLETERGTPACGSHRLIVADGRFQGGMPIGDGVDPDDVRLIVFHLGDRRGLALLRSLALMALVRPRTLGRARCQSVQRARPVAVPPQDVDLDDEIRARTPVDLSIDLEALSVVAPRGFPSETTG